eukprot:CAMPEP_0178963680 /NCGR_PEP_ID=MMETSP0789-20121207/15177_1 /TAXON_ID=3005 /ORGANISM="Rhizosolenia setigera, Strain CCMP 1694" /LENGTH=369 /DNA_ID=CAMNT_0020648213 /DNA_START=86 /DNA_END=1195 /DNA_ORIENTATION=+
MVPLPVKNDSKTPLCPVKEKKDVDTNDCQSQETSSNGTTKNGNTKIQSGNTHTIVPSSTDSNQGTSEKEIHTGENVDSSDSVAQKRYDNRDTETNHLKRTEVASPTNKQQPFKRSKTNESTPLPDNKNKEEGNEPSSKPQSITATATATASITKSKIKKARTAYFIFAHEKRPELIKKHPGEGVAALARHTGSLWSKLSTEEKQVYQMKAAEEREIVSRQMKEASLLDGTNSDSSKNNGDGSKRSHSPTDLTLPHSRIKRIIKLDPEVKGISKEATLMVTKCSELFTEKLALETVKYAQIQNRRKLLPEDTAEVCSNKELFLFLREDIRDLLKDIVEERKKKKKGTDSKGEKSVDSDQKNSRTLLSFWS